MLADLILTGGPVITVDSKNRICEAAAVKDNRIIFVGTAEQADLFKGEKTKVIDLAGRSVVPGFIDAHIHSAVMGVNALAIDCRPGAVASIDDIKEAIYERARITPKGEWIPMEALRMFTYNGAYASCEEEIKGSIEPGKLADLAVLDRDFSKTPPDKIREIKVDMTILDGRIEYKRNNCLIFRR